MVELVCTHFSMGISSRITALFLAPQDSVQFGAPSTRCWLAEVSAVEGHQEDQGAAAYHVWEDLGELVCLVLREG